MNTKTIWIIDDDPAVCSSIKLLLKRAGFTCQAFSHPNKAWEAFTQSAPDLLLLDMNYKVETSGKQGLATLKKIREIQPTLPIILMTGWATVQLAVEGMKLGAKDFIAKPWDNKQLLSSIKTILQVNNSKTPTTLNNFDHIIGQSPNLLQVLNTAKSISQTNASVLITGESGTGKELVAEAIHYDSLRKDRPFVKVNLGGISTSLFESELFGHKKGAFTDAVMERKGRTIFLDEIGELALESQVKLLRVLQEQTFEVLGSSIPKKIDIRVVSATNKELPDLIQQGLFREDLFYRINLISLHLPPLRERKSDIPLLAQHFVNNLTQLYQKEVAITEKAMGWLQQQPFPGNIRQLKNLVERTVLVTNKSTVDQNDFQQQLAASSLSRNAATLPEVGKISLEELEKQMILKALHHHQFQITETARSLGITRSSLYRRMEKYEIGGR